MLARADNELLTRVGPGTPMGNLLRRFWQPFALAWELPGANCDPIRVRLLGEDLVAFRDSHGSIVRSAALVLPRDIPWNEGAAEALLARV